MGLNDLEIEYTLKASISQPKDGNEGGKDDYQFMEIESSDCGGGPYFLIKTERWAFDKPEEVLKTLKKVVDKFKKLNEES